MFEEQKRSQNSLSTERRGYKVGNKIRQQVLEMNALINIFENLDHPFHRVYYASSCT